MKKKTVSFLFLLAICLGGLKEDLFSQNVGIGTNNPLFKLDVKGSINTDSAYRIGGSTVLSIKGVANTLVGHNAGFSGNGSYSTAVGEAALYYNSGVANTALGYNSLINNSTGRYNTATGGQTLLFNTTGEGNTANGDLSLFNNITGSYNTATGYQAFFTNSTGHYNTTSGALSNFRNTTGSYNTASGYAALLGNSTGYYNTATGAQALYSNTTGIQNAAFGLNALYSTTSADGNTAVGYQAGYLRNNGYYNTFLGSNADANANGYFNSIAIGNAATVTAALQVRIGGTFITSIGGSQNWTTISDGRFKKDVMEDVQGLRFIMNLRPVTYHLNVSALSEKLNEGRGLAKDEQTKTAIADKEKIRYSGFIAQEVEQSAKELGYDFSGVDKPKNADDFYGLRYAEFVVPLVKAIQEQQKIIDDLKKNDASQKSIIENLIKRIEKFESSFSQKN